MDARFAHGSTTMVDHTPGSAVSAGDVVVVGDHIRIAHLDIAANRQGALASAGGVYGVAGDAAIASGKKVYWNAAASKVTETASTHKVFGRTVEACSGDTVVFNVQHDPGA